MIDPTYKLHQSCLFWLILNKQWIRDDFFLLFADFNFPHVSGSSSIIFNFFFLEALNIFSCLLKFCCIFPAMPSCNQEIEEVGPAPPVHTPCSPVCLSACVPACFTPFFFASLHRSAPSHWIYLFQALFLISCLIVESREWVYQHKFTFHAMFKLILLNTVFICDLRLELYVNGSLSSLC